MSIPDFLKRFQDMSAEDAVEPLTLTGRIRAKRTSGKQLLFLDIVQEWEVAQIVLSKNSLANWGQRQVSQFWLFAKMVQVGDHICM